jgi:hypothetical protein
MKRTRKLISRMVLSGIAALLPGLLLNGQTEDGQVLQQYLFPAFSKGVVRIKTGKETNLILNYNMVSEKMVFEQKEQFYDLINPEAVDTVYLNGKKFIAHEKEFVEVLVKGDFSFFIQHKADLQAPPRPGGYGTTSELTSSNYMSGIQTDIGYYNFKLPAGYTVRLKPFYWITRGEEWFRINSEKQVPKIFGKNEDRVKDFIKEYKIKAERMEDMIKLGQFCNRLPK